VQFDLPDDQRTRDIVGVLLSLPEGSVVTYGGVAAAAGYPKQSRLVGRILSLYSDFLDLPWWRVVNVQGRLVPGQENVQATLLKSEGIELINGRARLND
jgi:methylated-DNA-protein-cysteine methyltransferase-like protein